MSLISPLPLSKSYPLGNLQIAAVQQLDLRIEAGEFAVLAGPSGSGKTNKIGQCPYLFYLLMSPSRSPSTLTFNVRQYIITPYA